MILGISNSSLSLVLPGPICLFADTTGVNQSQDGHIPSETVEKTVALLTVK